MLERDTTEVVTMSEQVARSIGTRIVAGEFMPGATLPVEGDLCQIYGVSRTTLREAMKRLSAKRLVDVSPKVGTRVLPFAEWNLLDRDVLAWRLHGALDHKIIEDMYELRLCVEPRASFLAARDGTEADHAQIDRHCAALVAAYASGLAPALANETAQDFHLAVIAASRNGLFVTIGRAMKQALRVSAVLRERGALPPGREAALHVAVRDAILARRGELAAAAMTELLRASFEAVLAAA